MKKKGLIQIVQRIVINLDSDESEDDIEIGMDLAIELNPPSRSMNNS